MACLSILTASVWGREGLSTYAQLNLCVSSPLLQVATVLNYTIYKVKGRQQGSNPDFFLSMGPGTVTVLVTVLLL